MGYKDTVMGMEKRTFYEEKCHKLVNTYHQENPDFDQKLVERSLDDKAIQICQDVTLEELEDQAETSFKAGIREVVELLDIDLILNMLKQGKGHIWQKRGRQACGEQIEKLEVLKKEAEDEENYLASNHKSYAIGKQEGFEIGLEQGKAEGKRELVEWLKEHNNWAVLHNNRAFALTVHDWQALMKEVGIE